MHKLYTAAGSGGTIIEAAFAIAGVPVEPVDVDWADLGWESRTLAAMNPLGQLPTLELPNGEIMTESAAIMMHLDDLNPQAGLVVAPGHAKRDEFLRWFMFLVSAIYPTFTYGDVPTRWTGGDEAAGRLLKQATDEHRKTLNRYMEAHCAAPWFLGDTFSCIDVYFLVMRHWRPGEAWFVQECPRLSQVGLGVAALPAVQPVLKRNWPDA